VAEAIHRVLDDPATAGKTYELGGPRVYTMREMMVLMQKIIGRKRPMLSIPFGLAEFQAAFPAALAGAAAEPATRCGCWSGKNVVSGHDADLPGYRHPAAGH